MKMRITAVTIALLVCSCMGFAGGSSPAELAAEAASADPAISASAVEKLRAMGYPGLDAMLIRYSSEIAKAGDAGQPDEQWQRISKAIDDIAMQKNADTSGLYWYTDLDAALRAAKAENKPILSLRLLGNLNEEFSCANSRLFRTVLYSDRRIAKYLRENYILHWRSVRPAPHITIDFGDGRQIVRTITGNSIHYILDSDGRVVDAIPGLYSPDEFLSYLMRAYQIAKATRSLPLDARVLALMKYRKDNFDRIVQRRKDAIEKSGVRPVEPKAGTIAVLAAPMAISKAIIVDEYSILRVFDDFAKYEPTLDLDDWTKLSVTFALVKPLDANSIALIKRQNRDTGLTADEFSAMVARLNTFVSIDTTRNEFLFHGKLYEWLNDRLPSDLETLNARVYDQIFKTPNTDKWLGLYSSDVYTALDGNGVISKQQRQ